MIKSITVDDIITGKVRKNDIVTYVYGQLENVELFRDTHGIYYLDNERRMYIPYKKMLNRLKGVYIRVSEDEFERF